MVAERILRACKHGGSRDGRPPELVVKSVTHEERRLPPPAGLSTLGLVRIGSDYLRLSGERTRNVPLVIEDERLNFPERV